MIDARLGLELVSRKAIEAKIKKSFACTRVRSRKQVAKKREGVAFACTPEASKWVQRSHGGAAAGGIEDDEVDKTPMLPGTRTVS